MKAAIELVSAVSHKVLNRTDLLPFLGFLDSLFNLFVLSSVIQSKFFEFRYTWSRWTGPIGRMGLVIATRGAKGTYTSKESLAFCIAF